MISKKFSFNSMCLFIILINIIIFLLVNINTNLIEDLVLNPNKSIVIKKPWTVISVIYTHDVSIHILGNMLILYYFGGKLEKKYGKLHLFLLYLIAGITGSLLTIIASPIFGYTQPLTGASAAVLGILGTILILPSSIDSQKVDIKKLLLVIIVLNIVMIFIDNHRFGPSSVAHLSGIAVGVIYGFLLKLRNH